MKVLLWNRSHKTRHCKCTYIRHHDENASPGHLRASLLPMYGWHFQRDMLTLSYAKRSCLSQCITKLWLKKYLIVTCILYFLGNLLWLVHFTFPHHMQLKLSPECRSFKLGKVDTSIDAMFQNWLAHLSKLADTLLLFLIWLITYHNILPIFASWSYDLNGAIVIYLMQKKTFCSFIVNWRVLLKYQNVSHTNR